MFVTFCRVLFSRPGGIDTLQNPKNLDGWIDYNIMGYFAGIVIRSKVNDHNIYIGLLFDYNVLFSVDSYLQTYDVELALEFPNNMEEPIKFGDRCYVMPHRDVSFCFVFPYANDAETFYYGVSTHDQFKEQTKAIGQELVIPETEEIQVPEKQSRRWSWKGIFKV